MRWVNVVASGGETEAGGLCLQLLDVIQQVYPFRCYSAGSEILLK